MSPAGIFRDTAALVAAVSSMQFWQGEPRFRPFEPVFCSGYFDPIHDSHLDYIWESATLGWPLIVAVNSDEACVRKKRYSFLHEEARCAILASLKPVDFVLLWKGSSMEDVLRQVRPKAYTNGGDRSDLETMNPNEVRACLDVKCKIVCGVGGAMKANSSSELVRRAALSLDRPH